MDFVAGGLSDEQRAKGGRVAGRVPWRLIDDGGPPGFYIPQNTKRHSVELLLETAKALFGGENGDE